MELEALLRRQAVSGGGNGQLLSGLISIGPLEGVLDAVVAQANQLAAALTALEERSNDFVTRDEGRKHDNEIADLNNRHKTLTNRFDQNFLSVEHLTDEVPLRLAAYDAKLKHSDEMHALELDKTRNELLARLALADTHISQRALVSEFRDLAKEVRRRRLTRPPSHGSAVAFLACPRLTPLAPAGGGTHPGRRDQAAE